MNKIYGLALLAIIVGIIPFARGLNATAVPPGVSAGNWIAIGDSMGFAITKTGNDFRNGLRTGPKVVNGYFMLRRDGAWLRVEPGAGTGVYPTAVSR